MRCWGSNPGLAVYRQSPYPVYYHSITFKILMRAISQVCVLLECADARLWGSVLIHPSVYRCNHREMISFTRVIDSPFNLISPKSTSSSRGSVPQLIILFPYSIHPQLEAPLRKCWAPSRHSGDSSLSAKEPRSSLTMMSAFSGASHSRMSDDTTVTWLPHSSNCQFSSLTKK